jgi:hypothetical protein
MRRSGLRPPACGAVTFVQRFGSALQLNVHFHVLVPDGAFDEHGVFVAADPPDDEDVRMNDVNYMHPSTTTTSPHPVERSTSFASLSSG